MRTPVILFVMSLLAAPALADDAKATGPSYEPQTYRFGGTYLSEPAYSPTSCSQTCARDPFCKSWSYIKMAGQAGAGACELKHVIGRSEANPTSVSGISPRLEDRYGSRYHTRQYELRGASAQQQRVRTVFAQPVAYTSASYTREPGVYLNGEYIPYTETVRQ